MNYLEMLENEIVEAEALVKKTIAKKNKNIRKLKNIIIDIEQGKSLSESIVEIAEELQENVSDIRQTTQYAADREKLINSHKNRLLLLEQTK